MLTGSGKVVMNGPGTCFLAFASSNTLTNSSTITGAGSIGDSNPMGITNNGTIVSTSTTSPLIIQPDVTGFTNNGKLTVNKGTVMNINGLFNNISAGTLTGGSYTVSGTLQLQNASITSNNVSLTLIGAAAQIFNSFNSTNALAGLASIGSKGVLTLQNGQALTTTASTFSSAGKVTVTASSSFTLGGSYTQSANTTTVDGTLSAPAGFTLQKGTLQGQGTVASVVNSSATVTAGNSPTKAGKLTISGAYTQTSTGILNVAIGGTTVGTQYSQLGVSNGASLGGTLSIKLTNSFVPAIGNTFTILTGTAVTGQFATVKGTSINSGEHFQVNYTPTAVTLTVVSGP